MRRGPLELLACLILGLAAVAAACNFGADLQTCIDSGKCLPEDAGTDGDSCPGWVHLVDAGFPSTAVFESGSIGGGTLFLVGWDSSTGGGLWSVLPLDGGAARSGVNPARLLGVVATSDSQALAAGWSGTLLAWDAGDWAVVDSGTNAYFTPVWKAQGAWYVAGNKGVWRSPDEVVWTRDYNAPTISLNAMWGRNETSVYAAGNANVLIEKTSSGWNNVAGFGDGGPDLYGVRGTSPTDTYLVGASGVILRNDGGPLWTTEDSGTTNTLRGLWSSAANDIYAVGNNGTVLHSAGDGVWTPVGCPSFEVHSFHALAGTGPSDVYVIGSEGSVFHKVQ